MTPLAFTVVDEHTARNPVARAVARQKISAAALDFALRLHLLNDGEDVRADIDVTAFVLAVALYIREGQGGDDPVIRGGLSCCTAIAKRGFTWNTADAPALDVALQRAVRIYRAASARETQAAYVSVSAIRDRKLM